MALGLAVVDNGNGTATATVTGAAVGYTVILANNQIDSEFLTSGWNTAGTREGNGTINVACGRGYYWWYCTQDVDGVVSVSPVVFKNVTDGSENPHWECLEALQARIVSLALPNISGASIVLRKFPIVKGVTLPAIVICPWGAETSNKAEGTNIRDDYYFPCLVAIAAADNRDVSANMQTYLGWRFSILSAIQNQRLPGATGAIGSVDPQAIANLDAWQENVWASSLLPRFHRRLARAFA